MNRLEFEIKKALKRIMQKDTNKQDLRSIDIEELVLKTKAAIKEKKLNFHNLSSFTLTQNSKKRYIKKYSDVYSPENILCIVVKNILDRTFKIKYPNRNKITHSLFNIIPATIQMSDFTIVKFDFKDYFNSVSSIYVYERYIKDKILDREYLDIVELFVYSTRKTYMGLCCSNAIVEIISQKFDDLINKEFINNGMILYERYIDDCIIILNDHISESNVKDILNKTVRKIFKNGTHNELFCKTKFNSAKFKYISKRALTKSASIDYLGYEFLFSRVSSKPNKISLKYGITEEKRNKYKNRIKKLIYSFTNKTSNDYNNIELLRHRILGFSSRTVYITKSGNLNIWKVKGFISNYGELKYFINSKYLDDNTEKFLKDIIYECFKNTKTRLPYFLKNNSQTDTGYSLYNNMLKNKTLLLINNVGYDYIALAKLCGEVGIKTIDQNGKKRSYAALVREYLIRIKVGY